MGCNVLPVGCSVLLVVCSMGCNVLPVVCSMGCNVLPVVCSSMGCNVLPVGCRGRGGPRWACRIPREWPLWPLRASSAADRTSLASATWHDGSGTTPAGTQKHTTCTPAYSERTCQKMVLEPHLLAHTQAHDMYTSISKRTCQNTVLKPTYKRTACTPACSERT